MNPYLLFALLCPLVLVAAVFIAVEILKRRMGGPDPRHPSQLRACKRCWGIGDCPICFGDSCPHCFGGACSSCGGTGVDLEAA